MGIALGLKNGWWVHDSNVVALPDLPDTTSGPFGITNNPIGEETAQSIQEKEANVVAQFEVGKKPTGGKNLAMVELGFSQSHLGKHVSTHCGVVNVSHNFRPSQALYHGKSKWTSRRIYKY